MQRPLLPADALLHPAHDSHDDRFRHSLRPPLQAGETAGHHFRIISFGLQCTEYPAMKACAIKGDFRVRRFPFLQADDAINDISSVDIPSHGNDGCFTNRKGQRLGLSAACFSRADVALLNGD